MLHHVGVDDGLAGCDGFEGCGDVADPVHSIFEQVADDRSTRST